MKKRIIFTLISVIFLSGCFAPRVLQPYTYTIINPPTTAEGKKCVVECKKIVLLEKQLLNEQYAADSARSPSLRELFNDLRKIDFSSIDSRYDQCVLECGGTEETKNGMR
jgi:hypothetical protein